MDTIRKKGAGNSSVSKEIASTAKTVDEPSTYALGTISSRAFPAAGNGAVDASAHTLSRCRV
jgi:hypothetical protein